MLLYLIVLFYTIISSKSQYIGEPCSICPNKVPGICSDLDDCPDLVYEIKQFRKYPQVCGFQGKNALVCCPLKNNTKPENLPSEVPDINRKPSETLSNNKKRLSSKPGEISSEKCKEYATLSLNVPKDDFAGNKEEELRFHTVVVGGVDANRYEFPHMVQVGYEPSSGGILWGCGGSLISDQFILTAAHCLFSKDLKAEAKYVRLGILNQKNETGVTIKIAEHIQHPQFNIKSHYDDIALLKLEKPVKFSKSIQPACLYTSDLNDLPSATVSGWGKTQYSGKESDVLQKAILLIIPVNECQEFYTEIRKLKNGINENKQICAGSITSDTDTCQGDSGGPLQTRQNIEGIANKWKIVGITSFGKSCGAMIPAGYTKVSNYIQWIEDTVWK